ncbi:MAG: hypothetical protein JXQ99_24285 [Hyphomicrobiaceae bacterium]
MTRFVLAVLIYLSLVPIATADDYCDKYKFGSPEWWSCRQNERGLPRSDMTPVNDPQTIARVR